MKNFLKSIFITPFILFAVFSAVYSGFQFFAHEFSFQYLGLLITSFTIAFLFIKAMMLQNTARTSAHLWPRTIVVIAGFLVGIIGYFYENNGLSPLLPTFILVFGWFLYVFWYSRFDKRTHTFEIGKTLPDFELETTDKKKIISKYFIGKPAVFMFYRGNWCPLCMAQIKELAARYKELEKRGVAVVLISPQPHQFSKSLAEKYQVNFQFLVDPNNKVAKQLGIFHKNGLPAGMQLMGYQNDTVMPTLIVTDANGTIIFADLTDNYRVRPEPETFLAIFDNGKLI